MPEHFTPENQTKELKPASFPCIILTADEIRCAIARVQSAMESAEDDVETLLKEAFENPFRGETTTLRELEADPVTAEDLKALRQVLLARQLEKYAERIWVLRDLLAEQLGIENPTN